MTLNHPVRATVQIGARTLTLETGRMAKQADGAVFATYGGTALLATAQSSKARPDIDFFPLTVEYREKTYAAGKVPGGFFKREMRPRDHEILTARSIDRPVRPMFPEGFRDETQLIITVMSYDRLNEPDTLAGCAAMAALSLSSIPYQGPGATVRVGYVDGEYVVNPTTEQLAQSQLDLLVSGTKDAVTMVEAGAMELPDDVMVDAILFGHEQIKAICGAIDDLVARAGKPKIEVPEPAPNPWVEKVARWRDAMTEAMTTEGKHAKKAAMKTVFRQALEELTADVTDEDELAVATKQIGAALHDLEGEIERSNIIRHQRRADGRGPADIREIEIELGVLERAHGSVLFTRGETQALVTATLGTSRDEQVVDGLGDEFSKRFMLHYNFPPYCVGEVRRMMGTSRREVGHGNLAERSVAMVMPTPEDFPYSVRVVSEILESNGSSSMASVCGASLSLFDAGCPLRAPVAGIAMGLIKDGEQFHVLSDILGSEDHNGDMDFKVTGTEQGVTALQMDIKIKGLSAEVLKRAMSQAKDGRLYILNKMNTAIASARSEVSQWAPRLVMKQIPVEKIGFLIGPGGKIIRALQTDYNVKIDVTDDGMVTIAAGPGSDLDGAVKAVEAVTGDAEIGAIYKGKVVSVREFGAFVEIFPGKEGLLHISEMSTGRIDKVADFCEVGDEIEVKVSNIDEMGRVRLTCLFDEEGNDLPEAAGRAPGGGGRAPREPKQMPEIGQVYTGKVVNVMEYGAFVNLLPGTDGLLHVSRMPGRPRNARDAFSEGQQVEVKVIDIDDRQKISLTMDLDEEPEAVAAGSGSREEDGGRRQRRPRRRRREGGGDS